MRALEALLLALFPAPFRARFRDDLRAALRSALGEASQLPGGARRWRARIGIVVDFVGTALAERLSAASPSGRMPSFIEGTIRDVRLAFRQLWRAPAFTLAVTATMALGIGANTAVFSVLYGVLIKPLPFASPEQLVYVWGAAVNPSTRALWESAPGPLQEAAALTPAQMVLAGVGLPERIPVLRTDARFLGVLGASPSHGRWLSPEDAGGAHVVVLRADEARRLFGTEEAALGQEILLDEAAHVVIGVLPRAVAANFRFQDTRAWLPIAADARRYSLVARLRPGVEVAVAKAALSELPDVLAGPEPRAGSRVEVEPLHEMVVRLYRQILVLLYSGVALVLLLACVNAGHLFLVRTGRRTQELAIRASLGAGRARLLRQLLVEGVCTAALGTAVGLALMPAAVRTLLAAAPFDLVRAEYVGTDVTVLGYSLVLTLIVGTVFGVLPALLLRRRDLHPARSGAAVTGGRSEGRLRTVLMVTQVALTLVVLGAAGLLTRALIRLDPSSPGFDPTSKLVFELSLPESRYAEPSARTAFIQQLRTELQAVPGVGAVEATSDLPFSGTTMLLPVYRDGELAETSTVVHTRIVTAGYLDLLGTPVTRGQAPGSGDAGEVWINEHAASVLWPQQEALGRSLGVEIDGTVHSFRVAGVLASTRLRGTHVRTWPEVFVPFAAAPYDRLSIVVHTAETPEQIGETVAAVVQGLDPLLPAERMRSLETMLRDSVEVPRFNASVMSTFAALTLALACVGIFGTVAHSVAARRREMGIRLALGADARALAVLVLRSAVLRLAAGVILGAAVLYAGSRWLEALLYGLPPGDPLAILTAAAVLAVATTAAAALPVLRAARTEPTLSLRSE